MTIDVIITPIGSLKITSHQGKIYDVKIGDDKREIINNPHIKQDVKNYFSGKSFQFVSRLKIEGTSFQRQVWQTIMTIPYGTTMTYQDVAISIGRPTACRAVANACGQNKLALFIPCHRVIGKHNLGGYYWGSWIKKWLLAWEWYVNNT
jgi:O-6-methylguanine DNA methyltransferase